MYEKTGCNLTAGFFMNKYSRQFLLTGSTLMPFRLMNSYECFPELQG